MGDGTVITRGDRELSLRFDAFPTQVHQRLVERITTLTESLQGRVEAAAPFKTGKLRSEIKPSLYGDQPTRVAGYVSIYAPGAQSEYAKAATLEYGSDKARRRFQKGGIAARINGSKRRIVAKMTQPVRIQAFAYLRGPFDAMRPEIQAELEATLADVVAEDNE